MASYYAYSESFSCLHAVAGLKSDHSFLAKVVYKMKLATEGYDIDIF